MRRRSFLHAAAALGSLAALPTRTLAAPASRAEQFRTALAEKPWLLAYRNIDAPHYESQAVLEGTWPEGLNGTLYRNGPAQHEVAGYRYHHWFDGDGMLQAFSVRNGQVQHRAKLVETHKVTAERKAQRPLYPGFASVPPNPAPVSSADTINSANISVLHHHDKLLALWEAGSPWEMDPDTLDTRGAYAFSEYTRGAPFSAHPRVEPDGTLWNFGYLSAARTIVLWHIDAKGKIVKVGKVPADPISMVHDFIVTERHIVLMVPPLHYEARAPSSFLDAHRWHGDQPTRLLVVDKNDFDRHYWVELPAQWVFHYGNAWEDGNGVIHFDAARAPDPMAMINSFREIMRGKVVAASGAHHHRYQLDTRTRKVREAPIFGMHLESEFPSVDPRVSCRRNRRLIMLTSDTLRPASHPNLNEVSTFDWESGTRNHYRYPDTQIPEEHLFVPDPASAPETRGWILGTALDWRAKRTLLNVFDVRSVQDGPLASAHLPYALPLGLHGKFVHA